MFCTRCGAPLPNEGKFCTQCGNPIPDVEEAVEPEESQVPDPAIEPEPEPEPTVEQEPATEPEPVAEPEPEAEAAAEPEEVFLGSAAAAAPVVVADDAEEGAADAGYALPDSAFEPQTQPEQPAQWSTAPTVSVVAPPPSAGAAPNPLPQPQPKRKRGVIAAAITAAVAVVAVVVAVGLLLSSQQAEETADEPTRCSLVTMVVPEDDNGQPYSRYRVTLKDPSGVVLSTLAVEDAEGFAMSELTSENGDYLVEIGDYDTGEPIFVQPVTVDDAYQGDESISISSGSSGNSSAGGQAGGQGGTGGATESNGDSGSGGTPSQGSGGTSGAGSEAEDEQAKAMNEAYLDVMEKHLETYGNANVLWYQDEPNLLSGVCLAELVDFDNDDQDELLVAYYDKAVADQKSTDQWTPEYNVEVWTFTESKAKRAYQNRVTLSSDDTVGLDIVQPAGDDSKPLIVERSGTQDDQQTTYLALETPDSFQAVSSVSMQTDSKGKVKYQVEGESASVDEYQEVVNRYEDGCDRTVYLFDVGEQPAAEDFDSDADDTDDESDSVADESSSSSSESDADEQPIAPEPASLNIVKCADTLWSVDDTMATLRNADGDSNEEGDEPETVATEADAREAIAEAAGADPVQVFWADFDGDGTFEAFGLVGESDGDVGIVPGDDDEVTLWFVAKDEAEQVGDGIEADLVTASQLQSADVRFLKLVVEAPDGDVQTRYFGVKDGVPTAMNESDVNKGLKA